MSSPARPIISTALALVSAAGVVGADLNLSVIPVDARSVQGDQATITNPWNAS